MMNTCKYLALLLLLTIAQQGFTQQSGRKFISYNVLHGLNGDSALTDRFVHWVRQEDPDIIAYQELNGYDEDALEKLAARYKHPYVAINTGVTHPIALSSKFPIVLVHKKTTNFWHSYLYANIEGVHVFVTHLSPFDVQSRRNDMEVILAHAALLPRDEPVIIAGDLNALAASDSAMYGEDLLKRMLKSEGRLEPKSGLPIVKGKTIYRHNLNNGRIDYTVTDKLVAAGFLDSYTLKNSGFSNSVPTKGHASKNSVLRRIDYIWVNQAMADLLTGAAIIKTSATDNLSDHYPVQILYRPVRK